MYIAILGRQPALGMAELERRHGSNHVAWFSDQSALVETDDFSIQTLGGTQKAGRVIAELPHGDWRRASMKIVQTYERAWANFDGKITLGLSAYGFDAGARDVQKTGIVLKQKLKKASVSLRLIPNTEPALSTATTHHNKLGLANNKVELIAVQRRDGRIVIAESIGSQNITAYTRRDQERPKRDAFVGMLPPKLAQIMINLASNSIHKHLQSEFNPASGPGVDHGAKPFANDESREVSPRLLDPFCGTGVVLQEAALMGYRVYGTDLADKMIEYSQVNLDWLAKSHHITVDATLAQGDAMTTSWEPPIDSVVCETYLGQPFSAPPSPAKLDQVRKNCDHIIGTFLKNIASQIESGTPLCIGVPAWRDQTGKFTHLPLVSRLESFGFKEVELKNVGKNDLLYYREDQIVARELLVLIKS